MIFIQQSRISESTPHSILNEQKCQCFSYSDVSTGAVSTGGVSQSKLDDYLFQRYVVHDEVSNAEILWCANMVMTQTTSRDVSSSASLFKEGFMAVK